MTFDDPFDPRQPTTHAQRVACDRLDDALEDIVLPMRSGGTARRVCRDCWGNLTPWDGACVFCRACIERISDLYRRAATAARRYEFRAPVTADDLEAFRGALDDAVHHRNKIKGYRVGTWMHEAGAHVIAEIRQPPQLGNGARCWAYAALINTPAIRVELEARGFSPAPDGVSWLRADKPAGVWTFEEAARSTGLMPRFLKY